MGYPREEGENWEEENVIWCETIPCKDSLAMTSTPRHCDLIPAVVLGCLRDRWLMVITFPGYGMADGGIPDEYPMDDIPFTLRMPNTRLFLIRDYETWKLLAVLPAHPRYGIAVNDTFRFVWDSGESLEGAIERGAAQHREALMRYTAERGKEIEIRRRKPWWRLWR